MKLLVLGSDGFIGSRVVSELGESHDVYGASRTENTGEKEYFVDLLDKETITSVLKTVAPDAIINCAGIVENSDAANKNPSFTRNLLEAIVDSGVVVQRIVVSGSAAEYGFVNEDEIPVDEDTPLRATTAYGLSKVEETSQALAFAKEHALPVVVARIFNPIGAGMHPRFLIPKIIQQVADVQAGERSTIEVSRLDAKRDYINVLDVAVALGLLATNEPKRDVYNVGSGVAVSNGELIDLVLKNSGPLEPPKIIETMSEPEKLVAIQADIARIHNEFYWHPLYTLEETVKEIMHAAGR